MTDYRDFDADGNFLGSHPVDWEAQVRSRRLAELKFKEDYGPVTDGLYFTVTRFSNLPVFTRYYERNEHGGVRAEYGVEIGDSNNPDAGVYILKLWYYYNDPGRPYILEIINDTTGESNLYQYIDGQFVLYNPADSGGDNGIDGGGLMLQQSGGAADSGSGESDDPVMEMLSSESGYVTRSATAEEIVKVAFVNEFAEKLQMHSGDFDLNGDGVLTEADIQEGVDGYNAAFENLPSLSQQTLAMLDYDGNKVVARVDADNFLSKMKSALQKRITIERSRALQLAISYFVQNYGSQKNVKYEIKRELENYPDGTVISRYVIVAKHKNFADVEFTLDVRNYPDMRGVSIYEVGLKDSPKRSGYSWSNGSWTKTYDRDGDAYYCIWTVLCGNW